jgi:putative multiple sugar transport system ATP-binding protein
MSRLVASTSVPSTRSTRSSARSRRLPELLGLSDRIYTLAYGRITGQLPVADATQEALMSLMTIENSSPKEAAA